MQGNASSGVISVTPAGKNGKLRCSISGNLLEGGEGGNERSPWPAHSTRDQFRIRGHQVHFIALHDAIWTRLSSPPLPRAEVPCGHVLKDPSWQTRQTGRSLTQESGTETTPWNQTRTQCNST